MSAATYIVGDVRAVLDSLPEASVDLVLTSWPFLALRSYLPADHPDKALEIGSESTPGEFIDTLLDVTERCRRVLAPHGSIAMELGDTYAGSGGAGGDYNADGLRAGQPKFRQGTPRWDGRPENQVRTTTWPAPGALANYTDQRGNPDGMRDTTFSGANTRTGGGNGWPLDKSLCMIPELFRVALVYGFNPLTGRPTPRWRVRNVVRWCRPNPPVGALADKVRPATSDIVVACTSAKRYFDLDAVRTEHKEVHTRQAGGRKSPNGGDWDREVGSGPNPAGAPPLDHWWHDDVYDQDAWLLSTEPYKGAHFATWPSDLLVKPIEAMCPRRVCRTCGEPSRRTHAENPDYEGRAGGPTNNNAEQGSSLKGFKHKAYAPPKFTPDGWTDCGHDDWRNGVVLDPFAGSGTTLAVATGHGRDAIGCDLDRRNADLARQRVGMFLEVQEGEQCPG